MEPMQYEETTRTFVGKKDRYLTIAHRVYCLFKIDTIVATDTFKGRATEIVGIFVGADMQFYMPRAPVLSVAFKLETPMSMAQPLVDISFLLKFLEDAEWSAKLSGRAVKKKEDTREVMHVRAVRNYERSILSTNPGAAKDPRFREMIQQMLEWK